MSRDTPAATLLRLLASSVGDLAPTNGADWGALAREALARDVGPLLHRRLLDDGVRAPAPIARALADDYLGSALRGRLLLAQRDDVLAALGRHGIPAVVLKGASLVPLLYDEAALRPMSDVDLLVPDARMHDAIAALRDEGYAPPPGDRLEGYHVRLLREGAAVVELHRDLESVRSPVRFDLDGLWTRAVALPNAPAGARRLQLADLLLHLCVHAAVHHAWGAESDRALPLRVVLDLVRAVRRMDERDWEAFVREARRAGAAEAAALCLALCARLDVAAPTSAMRALPDVPLAAVDDVWALVTEREPMQLPIAVRERGTRGRGALLRAAAVAALPAPATLRAAAGDGRLSLSRLYLSHWGDLLRRRGRVMLALLARTPDARRQRSRERLRAAVAARARATPGSRTPPAPSA